MPVFNSYFSRPGSHRNRNRQWALFYMCGLFLAPTVIVYVFCDQRILKWFNDQYQPMVFSSAADPRIISDIFNGKQPRAISPTRPDS